MVKISALGMNYEAFRNLTRLDETTLTVLEDENISKTEPCEVSEFARITNQDFNNFRRRHLKNVSRLGSSCSESLQKYVSSIQGDGGISMVEISDHPSGQATEFCFAFSTKWQKSVLEQYSTVLCLDSTHHTCYALDDSKRKAFLYTIVVKHDKAGHGVPVAFMLTSSEAQGPLAKWLLWLKQNVALKKAPAFMIDCSKTEMAALRTAFGDPEIRLCYWHMLRAIRMQAPSKLFLGQEVGSKRLRTVEVVEQEKQLRSCAVSDLITLIKTQTADDFGEVWKQYQLKYGAYQTWIDYLTKQWMDKSEMWWHGNRSVSQN